MNDHTTHKSSVKLCECGCGQPTPIAKRTDTRAGQIKGQPIRFISGHQFKVRTILPPEERFWAKVDKRGPDECWLWLAASDQHGYGTFWTGERLIKAHRFAYKLAHGDFDDALDCLHKCDRPPCCNPTHLFLGTAQDNVDDMLSKGRYSKVKGEDASNAMYSNEQVRQFREEYAKCGMTVIAYAIFKRVPYEVMRNIIRGNTYKTDNQEFEARTRVSKVTGKTTRTILYTDEEVRQFREEFAQRGTSIAAYAAFKDISYEVMRKIIRRHTYRNA